MTAQEVSDAFAACARDDLPAFQDLVPSKVPVNKRVLLPSNSRRTMSPFSFPTSLLFCAIEHESIGCLHYLLGNGAGTKGRNVLF
jgi:hypothetical protein